MCSKEDATINYTSWAHTSVSLATEGHLGDSIQGYLSVALLCSLDWHPPHLVSPAAFQQTIRSQCIIVQGVT